jgi:uncharacterized protein (DUF1800 family)
MPSAIHCRKDCKPASGAAVKKHQTNTNQWRVGAVVLASLLTSLISACGGGSSASADAAAAAQGPSSGGLSTSETTPVNAPSNTQAAAARFLTQATFGPSASEITRMSTMTYAGWMDEQFAKPQTLHRNTLNLASADLVAAGSNISQTNFFDSYWAQAIAGEDQLRQRAAFALSQIFVISFTDSTLRGQVRGVASYYDMLGENAFGNFRDLLEAVSLHPMMGVYLSHLKNQKEDAATGRVPDLNFAREITQLFTIGQYKLNPDGSTVMGADGKPAAAYVSADLEGLSQVFTGWSWYGGQLPSDRTNRRFFGNDRNLEFDWRPMQDYNQFASNTNFHSISAKNFFGVTIPAQTVSTADTKGDLKIALDTLFNHPNVGPFIGKQLIQRLVTSNPSPAYVARVTAAFNGESSGKRGDMKAVWKAVLLDPEARTVSTSATAGKVREPVLRLANFMRAFNATSVSGRYQGIGNTDDPASRLNQTPMFAPTVFNFYRPGYVPSSKTIADANLVAPEFQIVHDVSVAGYMNYLRSIVTVDANRDIQQNYATELALAATPKDLVERMNLLLFYGQMPDALKAQLEAAVSSRAVPAPVYPAVAIGVGGTSTKLADEGGSFTLTASSIVRYGDAATKTFVEKTLSGTGQCTNEFFGNDPLVGVGKACYLFVPTPAAASAASAASSPASPPPPLIASNQGAIDNAKRDRVYLAVYLAMSSPDYLIQK